MGEPYIGQILMFGGNYAPRGWALCDGQLLNIVDNQSLFSILGNQYGGDGRFQFALPDLRGRLPVAAGSGPGLTPRDLAATGGAESVALTTDQIPAHSHNVSGTITFATGDEPAIFQGGTGADVSELTDTGAGDSHENTPPFQCINFIIALQGLYPPRS